MKRAPTFGPKVYAIWNPKGGPDESGAWWQSEGGDFGDSPVVFFDITPAERFASEQSWNWNDDAPLQVVDVTDAACPVVVRVCRHTGDKTDDGIAKM